MTPIVSKSKNPKLVDVCVFIAKRASGILKKIAWPSIAALVLIFSVPLYSLSGSEDLVASLAQIPGLADSPESGTFVELVKAIAGVYTKGKITIGVFPFTRSVDNVISGKADFHIPSIRNPDVDQSKLPYNTVKVPMGSVTFVIYSSENHPITKADLDNAIAKGGAFPYAIAVAGGIESQFPFKTILTNNFKQSLQMVSYGRIDALVSAQEDADAPLRDIKLKDIHRAFWKNFDDVIIIPKGPESTRLDAILSNALTTLDKAGTLAKIHLKVHHSYDDWQPKDMGW